MPSHNPYEYMPADRPRIINWPFIILGTLGAVILIGIIWYFIANPLDSISKEADNLLDQSNDYTCDSDVYNCGNFTTQAEAQAVFDYCKGDFGDVHQLDGDGNGEACEGLA